MKRELSFLCLVVVVVWGLGGCSKKAEEADKAEAPASKVETATADSPLLKGYPLDGLDGVIVQNGVGFDVKTSSDGNGSLMVTAAEPTTFRLFEIGDLDVEDARIIYRAKLRTAGVVGKVYLEMWCSFPGVGEAFSRALQSPLTGTVEWTSQETPFFLKAGENPDNVKLNLVVEGTGRVWIDDIRLEKGPLGSM
jgi:hypothetical protein